MRRTYNVYSWRKNLLEGLLVAGSVRSTRVQTEMTTIRCFSTFGRLLTANLNVLSSKRSGKNLSLSLKAAAMFRPVAEFPVSSARLRDAKMRNKVKLKGEREREREKFCLWSTPSPGYPTYSLFLTRRRNVIRSWIRGSCKARGFAGVI